MEIKRIDTFTLNKRQFIYFDLSRLKTIGEFSDFTRMAKDFIQDYKPESVYTIGNVEGVLFDSNTKEVVVDWLEFNGKYVIYGSVINADGIKKIMLNSIFKLANRTNIKFFNTRQLAVEWLSEA